MEAIKAIETRYNGYLFRSRLEARWAVFFDYAGIKYEYEPEGYELEDGTRYLPDFYLPELDMHVEVKGDPETGNEEIANKSLKFVGSDSPINRLLILTNVPLYNGVNCHPVMEYSSAVNTYAIMWGYFRPFSIRGKKKTIFMSLQPELFGQPSSLVTTRKMSDLLLDNGYSENTADEIEYRFCGRLYNSKILDAYNAARQKRFEF